MSFKVGTEGVVHEKNTICFNGVLFSLLLSSLFSCRARHFNVRILYDAIPASSDAESDCGNSASVQTSTSLPTINERLSAGHDGFKLPCVADKGVNICFSFDPSDCFDGLGQTRSIPELLSPLLATDSTQCFIFGPEHSNPASASPYPGAGGGKFLAYPNPSIGREDTQF
ncbi:hypothetical protein B0J13DRAFT_5498 [Dactylonectria estremocensis]|uniref:Uncharacterized protein n=1 Tax=Dactylonectria estremocensis TaxID=1079267 RepID=A0A9P9JI20_9HYPO|nr:hypothetical protein B0J13DRAFT_5498 [Dactylonectria estremocensis]